MIVAKTVGPQLRGTPGNITLNRTQKSNVSPDTFGVAPIDPTSQGRSLGQLGESVTRLGAAVQRFQQRKDTAAAEEAVVAFEREKNDRFYNPETGYFNKQGRDAFDSADQFNSDLGELRDKYSAGLESDQAKAMFGRASDAHLTGAQRDVARHSSTQFRAWEQANMAARAENALKGAALNWNDPDQLAQHLHVGRGSVLDVATSKGLGAEATAEALQNFNSAFASNAIAAALGESAADGEKALIDYGSLLEGDQRTKVRAAVERRAEIEDKQARATAAVDTAMSLVTEFGDEGDARAQITAAVNEIEDAELRSATLRESMYQLGVKQQADSERRGASYESAQQAILDNGSVTQWEAQNPEAWDDLTAAQKAELKKPGVTVTNWDAYTQLRLLDSNQLSQLDPYEYIHLLAPTEYKELVRKVEDARNGKSTFSSNLERTATSKMRSAVDSLFGKEDTWNDKEKKAVDDFYSLVISEEARLKEAVGRDLSPEEYTTILNGFVVDYHKKRTWLGGQDWAYPDKYRSLTTIPSKDYMNVADRIRARGGIVTTQSMVEEYNNPQQGDN